MGSWCVVVVGQTGNSLFWDVGPMFWALLEVQEVTNDNEQDATSI